ncbi:CCD42 protein, partial [Crotophaga sulcirostris]|nr:CCD42 protein [Crotophaga sulcirostris]NWS77299.1 CCD42 protein [Crotophaga sulcirostris]NWS78897.1 CCD42 protein [Crotophaga sulcirostris]
EEDSLSSFLRLQKQKIESAVMQKALEEAEEAFKERMEVLASCWRDLHAKEAQLKADIETSERTLKDTDDMRVHALKKAIKEREQRVQKESELLRAKVELEALKKQHQKLSKKVQKFSIFNKYLEDVVKVSRFQDVQEVIEHYEALVRRRKDTLQSQQCHEEMSEQAQMLLDQHMAEKEAKIQQHKNELKQLQLRLDQARKDILQW